MSTLLHGNDLLKVSEVAAILRVDENTVRIYIQNGALPSIRLPQTKQARNTPNHHPIYRIRRATLNHMLDDGYDEQAS